MHVDNISLYKSKVKYKCDLHILLKTFLKAFMLQFVSPPGFEGMFYFLGYKSPHTALWAFSSIDRHDWKSELLLSRGGRIDPNINSIDTNTSIGIGSIQARLNRYFAFILQVQYVAH